MTMHSLLARIYNTHQLKQFEKLLKSPFEGLNVEVRVVGTIANRWVQIDVSGEDEAIATSYLAKEFGFCPATLDNVRKFETLRGYVVDLGTGATELCLDIGVFQPAPVYAKIPLECLQAQLVDGKKLGFKKIADLFGLCEDLPLNVKITLIDDAENLVEAELSIMQVEKFISWQESLLDRLIVLGVSLQDVKRALDYLVLERDIIALEPVGPFEYVLTCKLGTDAAGIVSKIGKSFRSARFAVFNPRKIVQFSLLEN